MWISNTFNKNSQIYFYLSWSVLHWISSFLSLICSPVSQRLSAPLYFLCAAGVLEWTLELLDILESIYKCFLLRWSLTGDFSRTSYDREWSHEALCQNNPSSPLGRFECRRASERASAGDLIKFTCSASILLLFTLINKSEFVISLKNNTNKRK